MAILKTSDVVRTSAKLVSTLLQKGDKMGKKYGSPAEIEQAQVFNLIALDKAGSETFAQRCADFSEYLKGLATKFEQAGALPIATRLLDFAANPAAVLFDPQAQREKHRELLGWDYSEEDYERFAKNGEVVFPAKGAKKVETTETSEIALDL